MTCKKVEPTELQRFATNIRFSGQEPIYADSISVLGDIRVLRNGEFQSGAVVDCESIAKPADVEWGYVVINKKALYNANTSTNFQLHDSEEDSLVNRILELSGIVMNKIGLTQTVSQIINREQVLQKI